ncbi:MAG: hypothetical protein Q4A67_05255 [Aerococcus sp.]|nr:hypothetical protein [Aerococcus sp.]
MDTMEIMEEPTLAQNALFDKVIPWLKQQKELSTGNLHYILDKHMPTENKKLLDEIIAEIPFVDSYSFEE